MYIESGVPNSVLEEFSTVCSDSILDINFILFLVEHSCWAPAQSKMALCSGDRGMPAIMKWNLVTSSIWNSTVVLEQCMGNGMEKLLRIPKVQGKAVAFWVQGQRRRDSNQLGLNSMHCFGSRANPCKCRATLQFDKDLQVCWRNPTRVSQLHICFAAPWIQRKAGGKCEAIETVKPQWHQREWAGLKLIERCWKGPLCTTDAAGKAYGTWMQ